MVFYFSDHPALFLNSGVSGFILPNALKPLLLISNPPVASKHILFLRSIYINLDLPILQSEGECLRGEVDEDSMIGGSPSLNGMGVRTGSPSLSVEGSGASSNSTNSLLPHVGHLVTCSPTIK